MKRTSTSPKAGKMVHLFPTLTTACLLFLSVLVMQGCTVPGWFLTGTSSGDTSERSLQERGRDYLSDALEPVLGTPADPAILSIIDPFRDRYHSELSEHVTVLASPARFSKPEGSLGNLVADALRFRAAQELRQYVHVGVIDQGSFKLHFDAGPVTLGQMYEFMPYENHLVVLELTGTSLKKLADEIAGMGGAPVSGLRFQILENRAGGLLVDAEPPQGEETYFAATSSWIADGGGPFSALHDPLSRVDVWSVAIRDLYIDYLQERNPVEPSTDGRIR